MNRVEVLQNQTGKPTAASGPRPIVVLGACFLDYIGYVEGMPKPGETRHSKQFAKGFGGKGANQAVMAGRLGAGVRMVSVVGNDGDGQAYQAELAKNGVACDTVFAVNGAASGLALIFVDRNTAQNEIVICPNATDALTVEFLRSKTQNYKQFLHGCKILVCQNEIPLATTLDVIKAAHEQGVYTIFNTAPAPSAEDAARITPYLQHVSLFCPNETEASILTGLDVKDAASAFEAVKKLQSQGVADVVITLGSQGYVIGAKGSAPQHFNSVRVKAVDTTGAGDCFVGAMTCFLNKGKSLSDACKLANICASVSVQRKGTQSSYPYPNELPPELSA
ncbi:ribokinase, putative [Bodo saltans]|uniref:Ribokinase n=1 Tax=Bodo saltans TaxID=75058 RepID=A0A0S4JY74_BODSA|nr:ribokinase, putative [Bodo saltans]|eukprot:CUG94093.1 ribokinase, putative [Bodo saltans]